MLKEQLHALKMAVYLAGYFVEEHQDDRKNEVGNAALPHVARVLSFRLIEFTISHIWNGVDVFTRYFLFDLTN